MDQQVTITPQPIGSAWCGLYQCEARFFIKDYWYGKRTLVVEYGEGYCGPWLPKDANGRPVFEAVIPDHWSHDELMALLLTPPVISDEATRRIIKPAFMADDPPEYVRNYPAWEVGARHFGSEYLAWPKKAPKLAAGEPPH